MCRTQKLIWDFPAVTDMSFWLTTLVQWFLFCANISFKLHRSSERGCCYSFWRCCHCAWSPDKEGAEPGVKSSAPPTPPHPPRCPGTFSDVPGLIWPPASWLCQRPQAAFPEPMGGLPAADICGGHCWCHSKHGPRSISFTWSLLEMQAPRSHLGRGNGICALTPLPRVSDVHYDFRSTTVEILLYNSISQPMFHRQLVSWDPAVGASGCSLARSGEFGGSRILKGVECMLACQWNLFM